MGSESCVYNCSWVFLLLKSYWHNVNTNNSGSVALLFLCLLVPSYIKIVLCCCCSCTFWVTRTWWLHSASSSAVCTPLGPALRRAVTLVWSFSSTWLYTALALPQMHLHITFAYWIVERNPSGGMLLLLLQLRLLWPLFSANDAWLVFCLSWAAVTHRNAVFPLFSFSFL